jgi:hypothetical protein
MSLEVASEHRLADDVDTRRKLDPCFEITQRARMRKIERVVEIRDRTTLIPGEAPMVHAPRLGFAIDALFALRADPNDHDARAELGALVREGACHCPGCGDDVVLEGFRRTRTDGGVRDEYRCGGCGQRFLLAEENIC